MHRVIRRSLIVAAALWPCFIGPLQAAPKPQTGAVAQASTARALKLTHTAKRKARTARKSSRHRHVERASRTGLKTAKAAQRKTDEKREDEGQNEDSVLNVQAPLRPGPAFLEPAIANAHAELTTADTKPEALPNVLADSQARDRAPTSGIQVAEADQPNNINRDVNAAAAMPSLSISLASFDQSPAAFSQTASEGDAWDRASLIGKIFIVFGTLLTMASAARLMMA